MSLGIIATKRRIKSVNSTKKITKAMELVSTSKLKRCRDAFERNSVYTSETYELVKEVLANVKNSDNQYLVKKDVKSKLYIVITSNLGLCGGYNANVFSLVKSIGTGIKSLLHEQENVNIFLRATFSACSASALSISSNCRKISLFTSSQALL